MVITGDFNIKDNLWNPLYPYHSSHSDNLFIIADYFNLGLSIPTNQVLTRYSNNNQEADLVIDLIFLYFSSSKMDNHMIHSDWRLTSDHTPLTIVIPIVEEHVQTKKHTIVKDSDKEHTFVKKLTKVLRNIDTSNITDMDCLNSIVIYFTSSVENIWAKYLKIINIIVYSKNWWNVNCSRNLDKYSFQTFRELETIQENGQKHKTYFL